MNRVLVITPWYVPSWNSGGTPVAAYNISKLYEHEGYSITVLATTENGSERLPVSFKKFSMNHNCHYFSYPRVPKGAALSFTLVLRFLKTFRNYDIIHVHGVRNLYTTTLILISLFTVNQKRYILTPHAALMKDWIAQSRFAWLINLYTSIGARFMTNISIHYLSEVERSESIALLGKNSFVLPNYVEIDTSNVENRYNNRFLMVGRIHPQKNFESAFRFVKKNNIQCLDIYGPIDDKVYYASLVRLRRDLQLTQVVNFKGELENDILLGKYQSYSALIVSSKVEGISMAMIEAMGRGLPVLFSNGVANKDALVKYFPSLFVEDWENNVHSVDALLRDYSAYKNKTRMFFNRFYSRESVQSNFRSIIKDL